MFKNPFKTSENSNSKSDTFYSDKATLDRLKENDLLAFNAVAESEFCSFVCSYLSEYENVTQNEIIQEASFELNISPVTAKRYLLKHTARRASFAIINKFLFCKNCNTRS
jgi:hypothetical protein